MCLFSFWNMLPLESVTWWRGLSGKNLLLFLFIWCYLELNCICHKCGRNQHAVSWTWDSVCEFIAVYFITNWLFCVCFCLLYTSWKPWPDLGCCARGGGGDNLVIISENPISSKLYIQWNDLLLVFLATSCHDSTVYTSTSAVGLYNFFYKYR